VSDRPWSVPETPWVMFQRWRNLLFAHWPLAPGLVRPLVPAPLELETREGSAWIAVTPFRIEGLRARVLPPIPGTANFPELNVRTYVRYGGQPGVYFFSLDADNPFAVAGARTLFRLPYHWSKMAIRRENDDVAYSSSRRGWKKADFRAVYSPTGAEFRSAEGSLEHWLTERYCLYTVYGSEVSRVEIDHVPWPLRPARADIRCLDVAAAAGLPLEGPPPLTHFAASIDVRIWLPAPARL
jgi:uncharacterized protein